MPGVVLLCKAVLWKQRTWLVLARGAGAFLGMLGLNLEAYVHFAGGAGSGVWPVGLRKEVRRWEAQPGRKANPHEEVGQTRAGLLGRAQVVGVLRIWSLGGRDRQELWVFRPVPMA